MAWSSPPVSTHCMGSTPTACPMSRICAGRSMLADLRSIRTPLAAAMCPRSATSPSLTSVIAVAPRSAAAGPAWYGGSGLRCASTKARGRAEAAGEHRVAGRRPAQPAGDGDQVARPGAGAGDGGPVAQVAERGDGHGDGVAAHHVAADHRGPRHLALVAQAVHQLHRPGGGQVGGHHQAEQQGGGHRAHGGDVGEVLGGRLAADVVGGGPVAPEVPSLQQDVGAGHHPAVGGGHHGGVVAGSQPHGRGGGEPGRQLPDEPELPQLTHGALHPSRSFGNPGNAVPFTRRPVPAAPRQYSVNTAHVLGTGAPNPPRGVSPRRATTRYRGRPFPT